MATEKRDQIKAQLTRLTKIPNPEKRATEATQLLLSLAAAEMDAKVIRREAVTELVANGYSYDEIGQMIGVKKARVYQILNGMSGNTDKYLGTN